MGYQDNSVSPPVRYDNFSTAALEAIFAEQAKSPDKSRDEIVKEVVAIEAKGTEAGLAWITYRRPGQVPPVEDITKGAENEKIPERFMALFEDAFKSGASLIRK